MRLRYMVSPDGWAIWRYNNRGAIDQSTLRGRYMTHDPLRLHREEYTEADLHAIVDWLNEREQWRQIVTITVTVRPGEP